MLRGGSLVLKQSVGYTRCFFMAQSSDHITGLTGASPAVTLSKAGAAFAAATNSPATEIGSGWYKITLVAGDTDTVGDLILHATAASADPTDLVDQVQTRIFTDLLLDTIGQAKISSNIKRNQTLPGFSFLMTDSTNHSPINSLAVTAQRSLGGSGFAPCANPVSFIASGIYKIDLAGADLDAPAVMLRFSAPGADDLNIEIITQP